MDSSCTTPALPRSSTNDRHPTYRRPAPVAQIIVVRCSDDSVTYNVYVQAVGTKVVAACNDLEHARQLVRLLNDCAWVQAA